MLSLAKTTPPRSTSVTIHLQRSHSGRPSQKVRYAPAVAGARVWGGGRSAPQATETDVKPMGHGNSFIRLQGIVGL